MLVVLAVLEILSRCDLLLAVPVRIEGSQLCRARCCSASTPHRKPLSASVTSALPLPLRSEGREFELGVHLREGKSFLAVLQIPTGACRQSARDVEKLMIRAGANRLLPLEA